MPVFKPISISEHLQFSTVRLETANGCGTGFYFLFKTQGNLDVPIIITNKHVVNNNAIEAVKFSVHIESSEHYEKMDVVYKANWIFHEDKDIDLCFCFVYPLFQECSNKGHKVFYIPVTENIILSNEKPKDSCASEGAIEIKSQALEDLSAIEDVIMVGYPTGLWDQKNNLPLFRRGITASHPAIDFNDSSIGVVDLACFPGSSGSPIFILNENGYSDKRGTSYPAGKRVILLGILFAGPQMNVKGELVVEEVPTQQKISASSSLMINLGYYVKSQEILSFKPLIEEIILKQKHD